MRASTRKWKPLGVLPNTLVRKGDEMGFLNVMKIDENGVTAVPFSELSDLDRMEIQVALITNDITVYDPATGKVCE